MFEAKNRIIQQGLAEQSCRGELSGEEAQKLEVRVLGLKANDYFERLCKTPVRVPNLNIIVFFPQIILKPPKF